MSAATSAAPAPIGDATTDLGDLLRFFRLDRQAQDVLRQFWVEVEPALPQILDAFYDHVRQTPHLARLVGNQVARLKQAQQGHWQRLFSGRFDAEYAESARKVGYAHHRIGLEPTWYVGGYAFVLDRLKEIAVRQHRWSRQHLNGLLSALDSAVLLDMAFAISAYQRALLEEREQRRNCLEAAVAGFDRAVRSVLTTLAEASRQMNASAGTLREQVHCSSSDAIVVASAAEQTSSNVQTVAAAAEQLSASISEIGRQVSQSTAVTRRVASAAERTSELVNGLADAATRIGAIVNLIHQIAGQTNLLALNATIEAARAGEAGRGFAVVAGEVKNLANQTAKATEEIEAHIGAIRRAAEDSGAAITSIGQTISEASEIATTIAAAVEEQDAATRDIAHNVQQAASGTVEVSTRIAAVTAVTSETETIAEDVLKASTDLNQQAETLRKEVEKFFAEVRK